MAEKEKMLVTQALDTRDFLIKKITSDIESFSCLAECVRRGVPLNKGHGRLIEESEINTVVNGVLSRHELYSLETFLNIIHEQCLSTIEADKECEE